MESSIVNQAKDLSASLDASSIKIDEIAQKLPSSLSINEGTEQWTVTKVRSTFINYFVEKRGHKFWPSSPVVPVNDPTLLFANAGMNQFKPLFLGTCDPSLEMYSLKAAVNSQKCIRAGGKHNDLDDVGKDVYHHTFFEMLGNWSFGNYFKEEAITWAWECLTVVFGIDPNRLYATYFGGDETQGLAPDLEAREIWLRFLPPSRVLACGCKENFWEMGATGPCGPCTEIHYDRIGGRDAAAFVNADRPDVIEIWNNVFIQFNREADGSLKELPNKHVDTGMGLERLTSVLQDKSSNYDTDIFTPLFDAIHSVANVRRYQGLVGSDDVELIDTAYRVVADHIRTLTFAITDGAVPSNDGRGYVLRRILRRAVRYGQEILGGSEGFFTKLVPVVVSNFGNAFPELKARMEFVRNIISDEERSFNRTLDQGVKYFKKVIQNLEASNNKVFPGNEAHKLFSAMGFPLDLTELMAAERGLSVDKDGFNQLMDHDRKLSELAEAARKGGSSKDLTLEAEQTSWLSNQNISTTDSSDKYIWHISPSAKVEAIFVGRGGQGAGFVDSGSSEDGDIGIIVDKTSFYYESGGQIYDSGFIRGNSLEFIVKNVQTYAGYVVHVGQILSGKISVNEEVSLHVDYERRSLIAPNHTMTHVLNYALRSVLINEENAEKLQGQCEQKGSLVDAEKLRFDFSWSGSLSKDQIALVEKIVNDNIRKENIVSSKVVPLAVAKEIYGLRQVFGEKYPDPVRVLSVGQDVDTLINDPNNESWKNISVEFCGGTHLTNTKEAEEFVIIEESGIAKGIRRIVGLTKDSAKNARGKALSFFNRVASLEKLEASNELASGLKALKSEVSIFPYSMISNII